MATIVRSLYDAKTHLSSLVDRAAEGEEVVITKNGVAMAKLVSARATVPRRAGGWQGQVWTSDDFDASLGALFEGGTVEPKPRKKKRKR